MLNLSVLSSFLVGCALIIVAGCVSQETHLAPVIDAWRQPVSKQGTHKVQPGETLYEIAWRYGFDYREVASINRIAPPYKIHAGQKIFLVASSPAPTRAKPVVAPPAKLVKKNNAAARTKPEAPLSHDSKDKKKPVERSEIAWHWPTKGIVIKHFSSSGIANKGIDITGRLAEPVLASANGEVVYSGNGLLNYGNLIIIKHNSDYLSAYAHNKVNLVKEGVRVKGGQKIAEMGRSGGAKQVMLHFEIRQAGKPVDPLKYLP